MYMPGESENIVSMEKFYGMLKSVNCTDHDLTLTFNDDANFAYAQQVWDWVNGADNHTFVMVAGAGDCEWNKDREPFIVSTISYDEINNVARLQAKPTDWRTIAHSYDLEVGHVPMTNNRLPVRDINKDISIDLSHSFPFNIPFNVNGLTIGLGCTECTTTGKVQLQLKASQTFGIPKSGSFILSPQGVSAKAGIKLTVSGELTKAFDREQSVATIPLSGFSIPKIVKIGPVFDISVGFGISAIEGSVSISSGATATLQDSAIVEVDIFDPKKNKFSNWDPIVEPLPLNVDAKVSGSLEIFATPALKVVAEVLGKPNLTLQTLGEWHLQSCLGKGFEVGLDLKMPNVEITAEASVSTCAKFGT